MSSSSVQSWGRWRSSLVRTAWNTWVRGWCNRWPTRSPSLRSVLGLQSVTYWKSHISYATRKTRDSLKFWIFRSRVGIPWKTEVFHSNLEKSLSFEPAVHFYELDSFGPSFGLWSRHLFKVFEGYWSLFPVIRDLTQLGQERRRRRLVKFELLVFPFFVCITHSFLFNFAWSCVNIKN